MIDVTFFSLLCSMFLVGMAGYPCCCVCLTCSDGDGKAPAELQVTIALISSPGASCLCDRTCTDLNGAFIVAKDGDTVRSGGHCVTNYVYTFDWLCDETDCSGYTACYPILKVAIDYDEAADTTEIEIILWYGLSTTSETNCDTNGNGYWVKWTVAVAGKLACATLDLDIDDMRTSSIELCEISSSTANLAAAP